MTTVLDLITNSLNDLGVIGVGETLSANDAARALKVLNNMMDSWATQSLLVYNTEELIFSYVAGQREYTIGSGGDFNTARPVKIVAAFNRINNGQTTQVEYPISITTDPMVYSSITTKNITTALPTVVYDNGNFPLKTLSFWPVPNDLNYVPVLWVWRKVDGGTGQFTLSETISLPPGYETAIEWNLAYNCSIPFGRPASPDLKERALASKADIMRINYDTPQMNLPSSLSSNGAVYALPDFLSGS